jgi:hypothetical protein
MHGRRSRCATIGNMPDGVTGSCSVSPAVRFKVSLGTVPSVTRAAECDRGGVRSPDKEDVLAAEIETI